MASALVSAGSFRCSFLRTNHWFQVVKMLASFDAKLYTIFLVVISSLLIRLRLLVAHLCSHSRSQFRLCSKSLFFLRMCVRVYVTIDLYYRAVVAAVECAQSRGRSAECVVTAAAAGDAAAVHEVSSLYC